MYQQQLNSPYLFLPPPPPPPSSAVPRNFSQNNFPQILAPQQEHQQQYYSTDLATGPTRLVYDDARQPQQVSDQLQSSEDILAPGGGQAHTTSTSQSMMGLMQLPIGISTEIDSSGHYLYDDGFDDYTLQMKGKVEK